MMMIRKNLKLFLFFGALLITMAGFAQKVKVTGKVTDAGNEGIPGASIVVVGTTTGTITDMNGNYTLEVDPQSALSYSFVGFKTQQVTLTNQTVINVKLEEETFGVDEVVVIGYGQVKKGDATGSVTAISSKDFNKGAITSPQDLLVGKSAGVVITTSGGAPGSGASIRIRGGSSLNASNDPLLIIDGVPIDNNNVSGSSNLLSFVNPNDIETFTVLKDASATAIYGSRASNGVILITTKQGKAGSPLSISYNLNTSVASAIKFLDVYSGDEIRQIAKDHASLYGAETFHLLGSENTNWQKEIFRNALTHDHNVSLTGSVKTLPYRVSFGYTGQQGIMKNTDLERMIASISLSPTFFKGSLKVNANLKGMDTDHNFGDAGALGSAINMDPSQPIYADNTMYAGYYQWASRGAGLGTPNPVEQLMEVDNKSNVKRVLGNIQFDYRLPFLTDLRANLNLATDYTTSEGHNNRPTTTAPNLTNPFWGKLNDYSGKNYNNLLDFYLNYVKNFDNISSKVDLTGGYSWQHFKREGDSFTRGYSDASHPYQENEPNSWITENYLVSFFGRANYTLMERYLLTLTLRDDGSSRFIGKNKWGLFPSAAFAWKIKDEPFLKDVKALSEMKLRVGWGITGQQDIGNDYPAQAKYTLSSSGSYYPIGGVFLPTLRPDAYDPNIKWEETNTQNIGLDFGFFNNRISGAIDLYKRVTEDLLNEVTVPTGSNFSNKLLTNVGSLENKGVEFNLNLTPVSTKDMSLNLGLNLTYNKNTITKLLLSDDPNYKVLYGDAFSGEKQVTMIGYPAYSFFVNKQVYDANNNPIEGLYVDLSEKGGIVNGDNDDKYIYHNPAADYLMGFSARFNYKNFDFSFSSRGSVGNYVFNQLASGASYDQLYQIGYYKNFPKYLSDTQFVKRQFTSDYFVRNASFFKLDNVSAGYRFENVIGKLSARVSLTAQNLMTITNYEGIDPEVPGGIDNNFYPRPRTYMLGVNFTY